jgi:hypothetical protein
MSNELQDHLISNNTYDFIKKVVTLGLPAFATFYAALGAAWGDSIPNPEAVVATCAALATFLGVLLAISTNSWNNSETKYDGTLAITGIDVDTGIPDLELRITKDPTTLVDKTTILFKSVDAA